MSEVSGDCCLLLSVEHEESGGVGRFDNGTYVLRKKSSSKDISDEMEWLWCICGVVPEFMMLILRRVRDE